MDCLQRTLSGIPSSMIYNYDETNLTDDPVNKKVITKRGSKYVENFCNSSKAPFP
ncbi:jerky protein-like [Aphis craccivora]|uniref:Jerky protein-like n=1 Tax=Aphis craccivora TaxID=307492 RepID=A0A6G0YK60_APHCR|nr:jerky protein-like [Aphis craccivora]